MKNLLFMILLFPAIISAQEYGDINARKKVIVARFETPFKNKVFAQFGQKMADAGYHVTVITPDKFVSPPIGTLTVYGEGALRGKPWDDVLREYISKNIDAIYVHTCKVDGLPPVAEGVDVISAASTDNNVEQTVKNLVSRAMAKLK